jgi:hypothetical protein
VRNRTKQRVVGSPAACSVGFGRRPPSQTGAWVDSSAVRTRSAQAPSRHINLVLYAGVLAPNAKLRAEVVRHARPAALPDAPATETQTRAERETWSELMRVTFQLDVLACPRCGSRLRHIATILDARVARRILEHLGLPARAPPELAPRDPPPLWPAVDEAWL